MRSPRDLAATADLPPALFSLQLLDLAHRWSEREDNEIHIFDVLPPAATIYIQIKLNSALYPDPDPFPDPQQPARPLADLLKAIAGLFARRQPHNAPSLHTWWTIQQIVTEEYRILGTISASLCGVSKNLSSLNARSSRWFLPTCLLMVHKVLLKFTFGTSHSFRRDSRPCHVGSSWFLSCAFWSCLQVAGVRLR